MKKLDGGKLKHEVLEAMRIRAVLAAEKESVTIGDVIGQERMTVLKIDSLSITVRSEDGKTITKIPLGGGFSY